MTEEPHKVEIEKDELDVKFCDTCAKPMPSAGLKCTACDSFQDWRRFFGFTTPVLSLLVALVAVISQATPIFVNLLTPRNSDLSVGAINVGPPSLDALVFNTGIRAGVIFSAAYEVYRSGEFYGELVFMAPKSGIIIPPGNTVRVEFDKPTQSRLALPKMDAIAVSRHPNEFECKVVVHGRQFRGQPFAHSSKELCLAAVVLDTETRLLFDGHSTP